MSSWKARVWNIAQARLVSILGSEDGQKAAAKVTMALEMARDAADSPAAFDRCSDLSVGRCILLSHETGLYPGGALPEVYLVPRGGTLGWHITHRGIAKLYRAAGMDLNPVPIHVDDKIAVSFGEVTSHEMNARMEAPLTLADLKGVCVMVTPRAGGICHRYWVPSNVIAARKEKTKTGPVWGKWPVEMAQKTAVLYLAARGTMPVDLPELQSALAAEPDYRVVGALPAEALQRNARQLPDYGELEPLFEGVPAGEEVMAGGEE